jgi:hypothetical protein
MNEKAKKWLMWCSLIIMVLSIGGMILSLINSSKMGDSLAITFLILLVISFLNLLFLIYSRFQNKTGLRKTVKIATYIFPFFAFLIFSIDMRWVNINSEFLYSTLMILLICFIPLVIVHISIIQKIETLSGIIALISYAIASLVLKRFNIGDSDPHLVFSFLSIGSGMYVFGLRCISIIEKNRFLKVITILSGLLIFLGGFSMMLLSSTYEDLSLVIYSISIFLMTLIVVLSLPGSGYIKWPSLHKNILKKIMIPWIFFLLMVSIRFVFPEMNKLFFSEKQNQYLEFRMNDYKIINKNGLLPE